MRIFKAVISALLVIIFLGLLVSAYSNYQTLISVAGLVDASSSVANHLVINELVYEDATGPREYIVNPLKLQQIAFTQEIGGDNFSYQIYLKYGLGTEKVLGPYGPEVPTKAVASLTVPVVVAENYRFEAGKLEMKIWRS